MIEVRRARQRPAIRGATGIKPEAVKNNQYNGLSIHFYSGSLLVVSIHRRSIQRILTDFSVKVYS